MIGEGPSGWIERPDGALSSRMDRVSNRRSRGETGRKRGAHSQDDRSHVLVAECTIGCCLVKLCTRLGVAPCRNRGVSGRAYLSSIAAADTING